jgi:ABC-type proline/glycine betaine transport system permease subunit
MIALAMLFGITLGIVLNQNRALSKRLYNVEEFLYEQFSKEKE